ncbi:hypothetical protein OPV22_008854 [Ensete ventricosum]|uniref:ABC transmembrane type-1 domain-containing protein n=1 Tax=Ensete ventricosum TaxID=4639 RepID=A0AAV8RHY0_ENSVE|nr:hypothetical protein OPV22_008854 [Ensete ventricosum]
MVLGSLGALGNGLALPLMTILFGDLIQSFGGATDIHGRVSKVASFNGERRAVKELIPQKGYTGGKVINMIFAILTGSLQHN